MQADEDKHLKGLENAYRILFPLLLHQRFGYLPEAFVQRVATCSFEELEQIVDAAVAGKTPNELVRDD